MSGQGLRQGERRCILQCFHQLGEAESALGKARDALRELNLMELAEPDDLPVGKAGSLASSNYSASLDDSGTGQVVTSPLNIPNVSMSAGESPRKRVAPQTWSATDVAEVDVSPCMIDQIVINTIDASMTRSWLDASNAPSATSDTFRGAKPGSGGSRARVVTPTEPAPSGGCIGLLASDIVWQPIFGWYIIPVFHPESKFKLAWLFVGFLFIVFEAMVIPAFLAFELSAEGPLYGVMSFIDAFFLADICLQFLFGYLDKNGIVVIDPRTLARSYVTTWLFADVVAGIPWDWVNPSSAGDGGAGSARVTRGVRVVRALRLLRLIRLMRVARLGPLMDRVESMMESSHVFTFAVGALRIFGVLGAVCHWSACVWYAIGSGAFRSSSSDAAARQPGDGATSTWILVYQTEHPYIGTNKVHLYVYALYFTLTTMTTVGFGDFKPCNYDETRFVMVLLVLASVVFSYFMGTLVDMIATLNSNRNMLHEKKVHLSRYMRWRSVPWALMRNIRQHLVFLWDANQGHDAYEEQLKVLLPPVLRAELCHHIYGRILTGVPFFGWMRDYPICIKFLAEKVQSTFLEPGDNVFRMGQANEQIWVLLTGIVLVSRNEYLFDQDTATVPDNDADTLLVFDIPRNKDGVMPDLPQNGSFGWRASESPIKEVASAYGVRLTGLDLLDAEVLHMATVELRREDVRRKAAARRMQRVWRRNAAHRLEREMELERERSSGSPKGKSASPKTVGLQLNRMQSRLVSAPAYFGESCLWQPLADWDQEAPPPYMYTVRCETRGELIHISRSAVKQLLERFAPWLPERFSIFRDVVHERLQGLVQGDVRFRQVAVEWTSTQWRCD